MTVRRNVRVDLPRLIQRGDPIRASDAQAVKAALSTLSNSVKLQAAVNRPWAEMMLAQIIDIQPNDLGCVRVWRGNTIGTQAIFVARPARLRSEASRDGVTYTYTDAQTRTASKAGETDEVQKVTPTSVR